MKKYNIILIASILFLTACQAKTPQAESAMVSTGISEPQPEATDSSKAAEDIYSEEDIAGTWHINGQKTEDANEQSIQEMFGSGFQLGNEMILSESGDFSYSIGINQGGKGTWKLEGDVVTADFTTYEPEVREEQLIMTVERGGDGAFILRMVYTDGYILYWNQMEKLPAAEVPVISQSDVVFAGLPEQTDYASITARSVEAVQEVDGTYGGTRAIWTTVNDGEFLYFYYTFPYPEGLQPEYAGYAIIGENIELACGLHVGMSAEEAEAIIPGLYHFQWENPEFVSALDWNASAYPNHWCQQFPQILIAEVDNGSEMPLTIGLMLDQQGTIKAIAFNHPTAG